MIRQMEGVFSKNDDQHQWIHQKIAEPKQECLVNSKMIHINGKEISYLNVSYHDDANINIGHTNTNVNISVSGDIFDKIN